MFFRIAGGSVQQLGIAADIPLPSLTDQMEVGEMFMNNHLPWDSVKPAPGVRSFTSDFGKKVEKLKALSKERIEKDPEYGAFLKKLELYNKYKDRKTVSLNEEARWREYREEKQLQDEADKLYEQQTGDDKKNSGDKDLILKEATNIAADFSTL